ncbi:MAG: hypothetical protein ABIR98_13785 [Usitatibacter sp.]
MARHFIYLTNTRLVSMVTRGKRIAARREFAVSAAGAEEFNRYLATLKRVPAHILTDLAEEDFRLDTVPHVGRGDRDAIFSRRLTQIYRNSPFRYAALQGREAEGRRDDRVLYTAVTSPEVLRPWLEMIERLQVPLVGVHSVALFSLALLQELDLEFPHTLLVTFSPGQALRQTYFRGDEFKFSRLTPVDLEEGQTLGTMMAEETMRTWQYLDSLRHFAAEDRLQVCVLLHAHDRGSIEPLLRGFAQIQYRVLDMAPVSTRLGLRPAPLSSSAEEVMVHIFLMRPAENHFASSEMRRHATQRVARQVLNLVSAVVLAAGLLWGGFNFARVLQANTADDRVAQQLQAYNREYDEITRGLPSLGVGGSAMRDAVTFYNASIKSFPAIHGFLRPLSQVLQEYPQVRLNQLSWQAADDPTIVPRLTLAPPTVPPPVKSIGRPGDSPLPPPPPDDGANPAFTTGRYEVALMEATVQVANNDFRAALERVERLAADISARPGYKVEVIESPLDLRPALALQGRLAEKEPPQMEPRFVLRIVRERGAS